MLGIRRDGVASKLDEVHDVRGEDRPPFPRRVGKLGPVVQLGVAGLLDACRVYAAPSKELGNGGHQILIEIDLHRTERTSPGYRFSLAPEPSAAFATIVDWTSS